MSLCNDNTRQREKCQEEKTPVSFFNVPVSVFQKADTVIPFTTLTITEVLDRIQQGTYKAQITRLRKILAQDRKQYSEEKKNLQAVTFVGTFAPKRGIKYFQHHSGFAICDLDHVSDVLTTKDRLCADTHVAACFISPSGEGLKFLVVIPKIETDAQYKRVLDQLAVYFQDEYEITVNFGKDGKDVSRLCFVSYDPDLYRDELAAVFPAYDALNEPEPPPAPKPIQKTRSHVNTYDQSYLTRILQRRLEHDKNTIRQKQEQAPKGEQHSTRRNMGILAGGILAGYASTLWTDDEAIDYILQFDQADDRKAARKTICDGFEHGKREPITVEAVIQDFEEYKATHPMPDNGGHSKGKGKGKATQIATEILKHHTLKFNEITDRIHINGECFTDAHFATIYCNLYDKGFRGQELVRQVILAEAAKTRFHPVRRYFAGLKWNGEGHIERLSMYISDKDNVFNLFLRKWLIGAVKRTYTGEQNPMLVMVGGQGLGKSYFVKWLCPLPNFFLSSAISPDNNDNKLRLCDRFIWEVGELGATTRRADIEALKGFLTLEIVSVRRPYARHDIDKPALANFIGTINDEGTGFLNDPTGHRRFRPILLTGVDWNYQHDCNVHQIWAEAVTAYKNGETSDLMKEDQQLLNNRIEEDFQLFNPLEDLILTYFVHTHNSNDAIQSMYILQTLYNNGYKGKGSKADAMELARTLKKMGVQRKRPGGISTYYGIREKEKHEFYNCATCATSVC